MDEDERGGFPLFPGTIAGVYVSTEYKLCIISYVFWCMRRKEGVLWFQF